MMRNLIFLSLVSLFSLAGCIDKITSSATGVVTNAATGALAGAAIATRSEEDRDALVGSAISGQSVTEEIEQAQANAQTEIAQAQSKEIAEQAAQIESLLAGTGAFVTLRSGRIQITFPEAMSFPPNSFSLRGSAYGPLAALAQNLNANPNSIIQILGHTDSTFSTENAQKLSEARAQAVARRLEQNGVSKLRIQTVGLGAANPVASNETDTGRQSNRRVEINIIPTAKN